MLKRLTDKALHSPSKWSTVSSSSWYRAQTTSVRICIRVRCRLKFAWSVSKAVILTSDLDSRIWVNFLDFVDYDFYVGWLELALCWLRTAQPTPARLVHNLIWTLNVRIINCRICRFRAFFYTYVICESIAFKEWSVLKSLLLENYEHCAIEKMLQLLWILTMAIDVTFESYHKLNPSKS